MQAILIEQDVWLNSQLSIARHYGGASIDGHQYIIVGTDFVRADFVPYLIRLKRSLFVDTLIGNANATTDELKQIFKAKIAELKEKKKSNNRQLELF